MDALKVDYQRFQSSRGIAGVSLEDGVPTSRGVVLVKDLCLNDVIEGQEVTGLDFLSATLGVKVVTESGKSLHGTPCLRLRAWLPATVTDAVYLLRSEHGYYQLSATVPNDVAAYWLLSTWGSPDRAKQEMEVLSLTYQVPIFPCSDAALQRFGGQGVSLLSDIGVRADLPHGKRDGLVAYAATLIAGMSVETVDGREKLTKVEFKTARFVSIKGVTRYHTGGILCL